MKPGNVCASDRVYPALKHEGFGHVDNALRYHGHRRRRGHIGGNLDGAVGTKNALLT